MKWKPFLILPLAALFSGEPARPPRLKPAIAENTLCPAHEHARKEFLIAYAMSREKPAKSLRRALHALELLRNCGEEGRALRERTRGLIRELCPSKETGLHPCP